MGSVRTYAVAGLLALTTSLTPGLANAAGPGSLPELEARAQVVGIGLTGGGEHPFPSAAAIRGATGFGVSPNAYRCPRNVGGLTFFRQPGGLGLTLLWRGRRHVSVVDLGANGQIIGATRLPCRR